MIFAVLAVTGLAVYGACRLKIRTSLVDEIPCGPREENPAQPGPALPAGEDLLFVTLSSEKGVFDPGTLGAIRTLSQLCGEIPGVRRVLSLTHPGVLKATRSGRGLERTALESPRTREGMEELRRNVLGREEGRMLVSQDERSTLILISLDGEVGGGRRYRALQARIGEILSRQSAREPLRFTLSGLPAAESLAGEYLAQDLLSLLPLAVGITGLILLWRLKNWRAALLCLLNALLSGLWALGAMGLFNLPLSLPSLLIPVVLLPLAAGLAAHAFHAWQKAVREGGPARTLQAALGRQLHTSALTAGCAFAGFASLAGGGIASLRTCGLFSAFGAASALLLSWSLIPAILELLSLPARTLEHKGGSRSRGLERVGRRLVRRPLPWLAGAGLALLLSLLGLPGLGFETDSYHQLSEQTWVRQGQETIDRSLSGSGVMRVLVRTWNPGDIYQPEALRHLERLQGYLKGLKAFRGRLLEPGDRDYEKGRLIVVSSRSPADVVKEVNRALHGDEEAWAKIPEEQLLFPVRDQSYSYQGWTGNLLETESASGRRLQLYRENRDFIRAGDTLLLQYPQVLERRIDLKTRSAVDLISGQALASGYAGLYRSAGGGVELESLVDGEARSASVTLFINTSSAALQRRIQEKASRFMAARFPSGLKGDFPGRLNPQLAARGLLQQGQAFSLLIGLGLTFLFVSLISASFLEGLFTLLPAAAALALYFGLMGWLRIPVDPSTAAAAGLGFGIGTGIGARFLQRLRSNCRLYSPEMAVSRTVATTGRALLGDALGAAAVFALLALSRLRGDLHAGLLAGLLILATCAGTVFLLPPLLAAFQPGFLGGVTADLQALKRSARSCSG